MYFYELEQFGWNWLTVSFILLGAITTWQWRAYVLQARQIWKKKRAKSISVALVTFQSFIVTTGLIYGVDSHSLIITYTGTTAVITARIAWGAWKFGKPGRWDKPVLWVGLIAFLLAPFAPALIYSCFILTGAFPLISQMYKLYESGSRGDLHGEWLLTLLVKSLLWTIFAYSGPDLVYKIFSPIYLVFIGIVLYQWWYYGKKETREVVEV